MSKHHSILRWKERGVKNGKDRSARAPGFGRVLWAPRPSEKKKNASAVRKTLSKPLSYVRQNGKVGCSLDECTVEISLIDFASASVDAVERWANEVVAYGHRKRKSDDGTSGGSSRLPPRSKPDFLLLSTGNRSRRVRFAGAPERHRWLAPRPEDDLESARGNIQSLFRRALELCEAPVHPSSSSYLEDLWHKIAVLLWAAYVAPNDIVSVRGLDTASPGTTGGGKLVARKLLLLHAALFQIIPSDSDAGDTTNRRSEFDLIPFHKDVVKKITAKAVALCPRQQEGMTSLAIAAMAIAVPLKSTQDHENSQNTFSQKVIERILELDPSLARIPTFCTSKKTTVKKQLPLHLAIQSGKNWHDGLCKIMDVYPAAADIQDSRGWLPIHVAAATKSCPSWVIHKLIQRRPKGASVRDLRGRLPLHLATSSGRAWNMGVDAIFEAYPEAAITPDADRNLPGVGKFRDVKVDPQEESKEEEQPYSLLKLLLGDLVSKAVHYDMKELPPTQDGRHAWNANHHVPQPPKQNFNPIGMAPHLQLSSNLDLEVPWFFRLIQPIGSHEEQKSPMFWRHDQYILGRV